MADIVIIGGGITGSAAAYWLAEAGERPLLIESDRIAAMGSGWSLGGVRQSGRHAAELAMARAAVALWPTLGERLGADLEYRRHGNLRLARTEAEVAVIRGLVEAQKAQGLDLSFLPDTAAVRSIAPAISEHVLAASFCPTDGHANPALTTEAFARAAERRGAVIRTGVDVRRLVVRRGRIEGVETADGIVPAGRVIVAAGVRAPGLLAPLGLTLPLAIQVVQVLQSEVLAPCFEQVFGVANANCAGRQEANGRLRVTSGIGRWPGDPEAWRSASLAPDAARQADMVALIGHVLPVVTTARIEKTWGGLIDQTPDALPVIDAPGEVGGLVVAAGFSGHGFCIGPVSGQLAADLALGATPRHDLAEFRLSRFRHLAAPDAPLTLHG